MKKNQTQATEISPEVKTEIIKRPDRIKRVKLLGKGTGWEACPDNEPGWEVWGLNGLLFANKKLNRIFMMDIIDEMPSVIAGIWELPQVIEQANKLKIPLISPYAYEEIPTSEAFPIDDAVREFGAPYFNNTIAFMIAYALLHGVEELQLWGINQASGTEYFYEKGCVEYWLGLATGLGVIVSVHGKHCELLINKDRYGGNKLYGYNSTYQSITKAKERFGHFTIKKLMEPKEGRTMFLGPEKSKGLRTSDIMGVKKLYNMFVSFNGQLDPKAQWTIDINDALNIARFALENKPKKILDLGTGVGTSAAVAKYGYPEAEVVSVEQFGKVAYMAKANLAKVNLDVNVLHREPITFTLSEVPNILLSGYKDLPKGPWDMVVVDGPGPFKDEKGNVVEWPNGDIFTIINDINENAVVYVDGRKDAVKLIKRFLSPYLKLVAETPKMAVFIRTKLPYKPEEVVDGLEKILTEQNYF